jgi:two-component system sensor histidine kinase TctE
MNTEIPRRQFSLRKRVAWRLVPPLVIILLLNAVWSYKSAMDAADRAFDRSLTASLKSIAESIHATGGEISVDIPYSALDVLEEGVQERVYYAIIGYGGRRITGYTDLHPPASIAGSEEPVVMDYFYREQPVRLASMAKRLYDPELAGGDTVTVLFAETKDARTRLAHGLFMETVRPQLLLIAVGFILVVIVLKGAFRPLLDLRDTIRQRKEEDLTPVPPSNVPNELVPLIDAINFHMARLGRLLQARRRFLADAAHQIRTPLTVLGAQAEYGQRQSDPEEMRRTFASLFDTIRSTRRMANQMLTLARAEPANGLIQEFARLDFAELVCDVAGELATLAQKKGIDLSFEGSAVPAFVDGNATMLREMVSNLIDNALRYTQDGGHVTLDVARTERTVELRVVDDGPGIPEAEREKVFQRFYRILGHGDSGGSGLGLAIVREICWAHRGRIALGTGKDGGGLVVEISLPAVSPEA